MAGDKDKRGVVENVNHMRMDLVTKVSAAKQQLQTMMSNLRMSADDLKMESTPYEADQSITTGLAEMQKGLDEAIAGMLKSQADLEAIDVPALVTAAEVKARGEFVKGMMKGMRTEGGHYKNGTKSASIFKALVTKHKANIARKAEEESKKAVKLMDVSTKASPVAAVFLKGLAKQVPVSWDLESFFKCVGVAHKVVDAAFGVGVKRCGSIKKIIANLREHMAKDDTSSVVTFIEHKGDAMKVERLRQSTFEDSILAKEEFEEAELEWSRPVNTMQVFATAPGHESIGVLPFCIAEARFLLSGEEKHFGVKLEWLQGGDLAAKLEFMKQASLSHTDNANPKGFGGERSKHREARPKCEETSAYELGSMGATI